IAGACLIVIQPIEPSIGREYIGRVFAICVLGGLGSLPGTLVGAMLLGIVESFTETLYGPSWAPAASFGTALLVFIVAYLIGNDYLFFAGYTVVQFVVLASAWNILGGYCGYVNFGTAAFFALGAYTSVFFHKTYPLP